MSVVDRIKHYQRNIEKCDDNEDRILHCISKLCNLPVTVQHLQETGVGRTVNALRKYEGGIGDAAKALVAKWKAMVANEESSEGEGDGEDEDEACVPDAPESYDVDESPKFEGSSTRHKNEDSGRHVHRHKTEKVEMLHIPHNNKHSSKHELKEKSVESQSKSNCDIKPLDNDLEKQKKYDKHKHSHKHESRSDKKCSKDNKSASKKDDTHGSKHHIHSKFDSLEKYPNRSSSSSNLSKNSEENHKKRKNDDLSTSKKESKRRKHSESETEEDKLDMSSSSEKYNTSSGLGVTKIKESKDREIANKNESKYEKKESQEKSAGSSSKHKSDSCNNKLKESGEKNKHKSESCMSNCKDENKKVHSHCSNKEHSESKYNSSSHDKHCDKHKDRNKKKEHKERKNKHESKSSKDSKHSKHGSKEPKEVVKTKQEINRDEGIDCHSGASFAEALGMCTMTQLSKKRSNNSPSSSSTKIIKTEQIVTVNKKTPPKTESSAETLQTPSLLSSTVKLEPLSVDLASTLPEISPNYKPLPYVNPVHRKEEDKALTDVIYVKNQRTKVYSGNKCGYTTVPTLFELCTRVLIENIDALEFTGGVPFDILKPILERASPDQLFMLEHYNPYLVEDTDCLWQFHCNREFRNKQREEMETWREMYMRCLDEREAKLKALTANIKQSIDKSVPVRSTKLAYVDNVVKPPRNILKKQAKYGTANCVPSTASTLKKKLISGGNADATNISVPPPPISRARPSSGVVKKTKAPLMAKALQLIKGRYKR